MAAKPTASDIRPSEDDPGQHVTADVVSAQKVVGAWCLVGHGDIDGKGVDRIEERTENGDENDDAQNDEADHRPLVTFELTPHVLPQRPMRLVLDDRIGDLLFDLFLCRGHGSMPLSRI